MELGGAEEIIEEDGVEREVIAERDTTEEEGADTGTELETGADTTIIRSVFSAVIPPALDEGSLAESEEELCTGTLDSFVGTLDSFI